MRVSAVCVIIGWLFASAAGAQAPAGAPAGTYNAAASTSGAFTGDDLLYAGNAGFWSRETGPGDTIISFKKIVVTESSQFWAVTGNGTSASGNVLNDFAWEITVDPVDGSVATDDPMNGSIVDELLTLTDLILRGPGFVGGISLDFEVMLNPSDGDGFILVPGEYYVAVWTDVSPFSYSWLWNELSTMGIPSDIFYADALHSLGEFDHIQGFNTLGGQTMQTGDLAFDVWMTPVGCAGDLDGDGAVGSSDLAVLLAAWGTDGADLDGDGVTGSADLAVLLAAWGEC